jgi:hypothetical protein
MPRKVVDRAERRRRLKKVYDVLLELGRRQKLLTLDTPRDQPQPADRAAAIGGSLQTGSDSLERHQTQADLDGFVHPLHRLRGQMPPISSHPPLVYRADLV